jgi:hypothetical protein
LREGKVLQPLVHELRGFPAKTSARGQVEHSTAEAGGCCRDAAPTLLLRLFELTVAVSVLPKLQQHRQHTRANATFSFLNTARKKLIQLVQCS